MQSVKFLFAYFIRGEENFGVTNRVSAYLSTLWQNSSHSSILKNVMETLDSISQLVNSLPPGRCDSNSKIVISNIEIYVCIYYDKASLDHNEFK